MGLPRDSDYVVSLLVGDPDQIRLERGDITDYPAEAIVNAANAELLPGGGVCGAIHRVGGPTIAEECRRIRLERGPLQDGEAVATTGGNLKAKFVIHAVGPVWRGGDQGEPEALSSCYRESIRIADDLELHSIAFPAISTGIFGYPVEQAAWVAIPTLIENFRSVKHLVFVSIVLFDKNSLDVFASVATSQRQPVSGNPYKVAIGIINE
jgi:O-acetyl-ADP-ribose deacetylase